MYKLPFTKMHGIGNDFVVVDALARDRSEDADWPRLARQVCDRHFGIGADGLVLILPSDIAHFRMRMFNPDGSESQMCGNGIRCFARYIAERGLADNPDPAIETLAGVMSVHVSWSGASVDSVRVNMGVPVLAGPRIPVRADLPLVKDYPLEVDGQIYPITCVSMGNPHAVQFLDRSSVEGLNLPALGPRFEHHPFFPERTNSEFCAVLDSHIVRMRVWERGAGETLACGTGACASAVAAILHDYASSPVKMLLDGGELTVEWQGVGQPVFMAGPAAFICDGEFLL